MTHERNTVSATASDTSYSGTVFILDKPATGFKKIQPILSFTFRNYTFGSKNASKRNVNLFYSVYIEMSMTLFCIRYMEKFPF